MSCTFATQPALLLLAALLSAPAAAFEHDLPPYPGVHGARISHEEARARLRSSGSDTPHEIYPANTKQTKPVRYHIEQTVGKWPSERFISGSLTVIPNPAEQFSFVPPLGGCVRNRIQPHITSKSHGCTYASNAGFFDVHNGDCLGTLVSNGTVVINTGYQNSMFGITKGPNSTFTTGYFAAEAVSKGGATDYSQLIAGVLWLVRTGKPYVTESLQVENMTVQATGDNFASVHSARTAVGHDSDGNALLLSIDGKTGQRGVSLYEMADILIQFGSVNAINLDGGGSATMVQNNAVVNYPSDDCGEPYRGQITHCERAVAAIACIYDKTIQKT